MFQYSFSENDRQKAREQSQIQSTKRTEDRKQQITNRRIGNLGEIAFANFCLAYIREWKWLNFEAIKTNQPEYNIHDFNVFGYSIDIKTSRDISRFRTWRLAEQDLSADICMMVWIRDKTDYAVLLGWALTQVLNKKGDNPFSEISVTAPLGLEHMYIRPMYEFLALGSSVPLRIGSKDHLNKEIWDILDEGNPKI